MSLLFQYDERMCVHRQVSFAALPFFSFDIQHSPFHLPFLLILDIKLKGPRNIHIAIIIYYHVKLESDSALTSEYR